MYKVESKGEGIGCMILSLLLLGTWPALLAMLERRGRLPQHTYLDYSITNLLAAVFIALTFGQFGTSTPQSPDFLTQLSQDNWPSVLFAMAGGMVLSLGNLSTQYAFAFVGLSLTQVVSSSVAAVIGTSLNYCLDDKFKKNEFLFPGAGCFIYAIVLACCLHESIIADNTMKLGNRQAEDGSSSAENAKFGTAHFLLQLENTRSIKTFGKGPYIGFATTLFAGMCFSVFSPAFNLATNDQWHTLKDGVPRLTVYTAFFYSSSFGFVIAMVLNITFLYRPPLNAPKSSLKAYLNDWNGRGWALLAGLLCGFGNGLQFMGGQAAGYAAANVVQALPLVSTFWGVILFGEYKRSSRKTYRLLTGVFVMFTSSVVFLMISSAYRN